ncbi:MAG: hypothetical protein M3214_05940 [Actinomycetota bacterium]|nr:hypothetical protein [Actinomycetota bacterium]
MARLAVRAEAEDTLASPGNSEPCYIALSITTGAGEPVSGLSAADFRVEAIVLAPGGALVGISEVSARALPGFYLMRIAPNEPNTWRAGVYIFGLLVETENAQGQALAKVSLD